MWYVLDDNLTEAEASRLVKWRRTQLSWCGYELRVQPSCNTGFFCVQSRKVQNAWS